MPATSSKVTRSSSLGLDPAGGRLPERAHDAAARRVLAHHVEPDAHDQQPRHDAQQQVHPERPPAVRRLGVDDHVLAGDQPRQLRPVDEGRNLRLEQRDVDRLGAAGRVVPDGALELAVDRVLERADRLDVAGLAAARRRTAGRAPAAGSPPLRSRRRARGSAPAALRTATTSGGRAGSTAASPRTARRARPTTASRATGECSRFRGRRTPIRRGRGGFAMRQLQQRRG